MDRNQEANRDFKFKTLNELKTKLSTAQSTSAAVNLISEVGKIEAESNVRTLQARGTVTEKDLLTGKADY